MPAPVPRAAPPELHPNHALSPWLGERLSHPPLAGGFATLRAQWKVTEITVTCLRPPELRPGDWMPYAIRGAVGAELFHRELPGPRRASAWQALFHTGHAQVGQRHVPGPLLLDAVAGDAQVIVTARLQGFAALWRDALLGALITALNAGVSVWQNSPIRRPWPVRDFSYVVGCELPATPTAPRLRVRPRGPLCYGAERHHRDEPERFLQAALGRVGLIARWHGVALELSVPDLAEIRSAALVRKVAQGRVTRLAKQSRRHPATRLPLEGEASELLFDIRNLAWREALSVASQTGAGGHVAFGFGRFDLSSW